MLLAFLPVLVIGEPSAEQDTSAEKILAAVRSQFPSEAVEIEGTITVRRRRGAVVKEVGYTMDASWKQAGGVFKCVFSDALGRESDSVDVSFKAGGEPVIKTKGNALVDELGQVKGTALDCRDLAMPFLWWKSAELIGREMSRGRDCSVIEMTAPGGKEKGRVKVWIDNAIFIVLKAESYDAKDELVKQVTVKSFKKVDGQWMIKDLELVAGPSATKTVVTVESMVSKKKGGSRKDS